MTPVPVEISTAFASHDHEPLVLGLDIGGANIKAADSTGRSFSRPFPLWQSPEKLADHLNEAITSFPPANCFAVTMTGELADCFLDRADGVSRIVTQCQKSLGPKVLFYSVDGAFLDAEAAIQLPDHVAASNWHAIGSLAARWCEGTGLLIDVGSTTCDIIPLAGGQPRTLSRTDFDRLKTGELVYLGIGRTPICSIVDALPYRGQMVPVMNEVFATMDDCVILTGHIDEQPDDLSSCDARPRTKFYSANRMARMLGLDHRNLDADDARSMAMYVSQQWRARIQVAAEILSPPAATWILSGHGACLLEVPNDRRCIDLSVVLGPDLSRTAPAYAVARLALEKIANFEAVPSNS
jgi:(4-(4-[2-(gamma-L-glutamylamino)ethyl]phenoxymethyl)furan-2-yl)methanamine synthase